MDMHKMQIQGKTISVRRGMNYLAAARRGGVLLPTKCGGRGACKACKVRITAEGPLSPLTRMEQHMLSEEEIAEGYRLACQTLVVCDATVETPEDPLKRAIRLQLEAAKREKEQQEQAAEQE